ncbi:MAG: hypothetical protein HKN09_12130 [Saprospiraceae bacterium]|nr:hypothetical protein [Saprospiraceae bacterium]
MLREQDDLETVGQLLTTGKVILCPTDTIWNLCCNAFNEHAVNKLIQIKGGLEHKQLSLLVHSVEQLKRYIVSIHPRIETLLAFYERPLTVLYDNTKNNIAHLRNKNGQVAIRITQDPYLKDLIEQLGKPILATGAHINKSKYPPTFEDINHDIRDAADYVFWSGRFVKDRQIPSLLISYNEDGELIFLR